MDDRTQIYAPPPSPRRPEWGTLARVLLPGLVVAFFGFALGAYVSLAARSETFTGESVVDRPSTQQFSLVGLSRRVNILIIGTDVTLGNRRQVLPVARADSLLLTSFDPDDDRISVLSIPRDTRAAIPGVGTTKINAAYAFGGPGLTVRTVEELLGVKVDYFVKLGPKSFARLVDAIGGVEIDVEKDMRYTDNWAGLHINLKKGLQVLDGDQAEGYIRFRHDALGDIGRVERQQKVLLAIAAKLRSPAMLVRTPQLIRAFTENTQTNLTLKELMALGLFALRVDPDTVQTATLPGTFAPNFWEPDWPKVRATVLDMFYGVTPEMLAGTRLEVLNASGVPGLARRTAGRLERLGFRVVRIGTAEQIPQSVIIDRGGQAPVIRLLAELLGQPRIEREAGAAEASGRTADVTLLLARDYASVSQGPPYRR